MASRGLLLRISCIWGHASAGLVLGEHVVGEVEPGLDLVRAQASARLEGGHAVEERPGDFRARAVVVRECGVDAQERIVERLSIYGLWPRANTS